MISWRNISGGMGNQMFQIAHIIAEQQKGVIPDIYLQDPKYFENVKQQIQFIYGQGIDKPTDMVAVHVRRGDYVGNSFYVNLCNIDYYEQAFNLFHEKKFLVFSDDIEFCKQYFRASYKEYKFEYFHGTELEDFNQMASCVGQIIANSSFSWWAGYVSPFTRKVVAPSVKNWYTDKVERTVCPPEWVRI